MTDAPDNTSLMILAIVTGLCLAVAVHSLVLVRLHRGERLHRWVAGIGIGASALLLIRSLEVAGTASSGAFSMLGPSVTGFDLAVAGAALGFYVLGHKRFSGELTDLKARVGSHGAALAERDLEFEAAVSDAKAAAEAKGAFLANMSHEIRTPMNGVLGTCELLLDMPQQAEERELLTMVHSSALALLTVLDDILDYSKIEAGKLDIECVDFNVENVVEEVTTLQATSAHAKGLEIAAFVDPDVPSLVASDPVRLRQILNNLINNAVKFTSEGGVAVRVSRSERTRTTDLLRFDVVDSGIGIAEEQVPDLFLAFEQADASTTRRFGGTGLGLTITKCLVEAMGGRLEVESQPGEGSTFWFELPFRRREPTCRSVSGEDPFAGIRALVVDDNNTNRALLAEQLQRWGLVVEAARDSTGVLGLLEAALDAGTPWQIAIIDYQMPGMNGITLASEIRKDPRFNTLRLVLATSVAERGLRDAAFAAGCEAFEVKPLRMRRLRETLAEILDDEETPTLKPLRKATEPGDVCQGHALVVEDNPVNQRVVRSMLRRLGWTSDLAANGVEALRKLDTTHFDMVLMDCQMPVMDGYEATIRLRELEAGTDKRMPVCGVSAAAFPADRQKAMNSGMDDYLAKPVQMPQLAEALQRLSANDRARAAS